MIYIKLDLNDISKIYSKLQKILNPKLLKMKKKKIWYTFDDNLLLNINNLMEDKTKNPVMNNMTMIHNEIISECDELNVDIPFMNKIINNNAINIKIEKNNWIKSDKWE